METMRGFVFAGGGGGRGERERERESESERERLTVGPSSSSLEKTMQGVIRHPSSLCVG